MVLRRSLSLSIFIIGVLIASAHQATATTETTTPSIMVDQSAGTTVPPLTYTLFATRIGLVGANTANGHKVAERDHFVALPSRRGLNRNDQTRDYQVQVCYQGVCETAPVWDVGPWNIKDDYWNPPHVREMWSDLPQGTPESQAANQNGYNGGHDGFGRQVLNPAGIDLADGLFWDGLGMSNNDWIEVTFLWTGGVTATVNADTLNIRNGPSTNFGITRTLARNAEVVVNCYAFGTNVTGPTGETNRWDRINQGGYISDAFVDRAGVEPPQC